ncbi:hypothetical protein D9758_007563 [Tetrapyrgos nigripes]|uniref:Uncharacterized protein n=1 Tax=Tetrapyrgos nigripes TaxID=182062 RepID=A0A8H5G7Y3_9AGAR|nr:hypothetical protein D9758_007563 [Tetrapyrgos nigripes]
MQKVYITQVRMVSIQTITPTKPPTGSSFSNADGESCQQAKTEPLIIAKAKKEEEEAAKKKANAKAEKAKKKAEEEVRKATEEAAKNTQEGGTNTTTVVNMEDGEGVEMKEQKITIAASASTSAAHKLLTGDDDVKADTRNVSDDMLELDPLQDAVDASEEDSIFLGLKVYTKKEVSVMITGQLRHELEVSAKLALV